METEYTSDITDGTPLTYWPNFSTEFQKEQNDGRFYLTEITGNVHTKIRVIGLSEAKQIEEAHRVLNDYLFFVRKNRELRRNYEECMQTFDRYKEMVKQIKSPEFDRKELEIEIYTEVNCKMA